MQTGNGLEKQQTHTHTHQPFLPSFGKKQNISRLDYYYLIFIHKQFFSFVSSKNHCCTIFYHQATHTHTNSINLSEPLNQTEKQSQEAEKFIFFPKNKKVNIYIKISKIISHKSCYEQQNKYISDIYERENFHHKSG
jgi:hypothetical protein